ncbi:hypothetical protein CUU60_24190 [Paenibacillus polymyxa ATCC 842]|nr:hypothetical protein [Paenibacillus polymyxa]UOD88114.1 hypothetical protein CUU60_24190 [Paenibacillus polymyxa ATCC 842]
MMPTCGYVTLYWKRATMYWNYVKHHFEGKRKLTMIKYILIPINNLTLFTLEKMITHLPESIHNMWVPTLFTNGLIALAEVLSPICDRSEC